MRHEQIQDRLLDFFPAERQQRIDLISHLIPNSRQPILLRGPEQSGKSFFLRRLHSEIQSEYNVILPVFSRIQSGESIFDELQRTFDEGDNVGKQVQSRLEAWSNLAKLVVLIIEDAHLIEPSLMADVIELPHQYTCVRLVFSSSENLGDKVETGCHLIDLEPFSQKQTIEYARLRVSRKGFNQACLTGIDDVVLFIETGGLPGRINDVLAQFLKKPNKLEKADNVKSKNRTLVTAIAGILLLFVSLFFLLDDKTAIEVEGSKKVTNTTMVAQPQNLKESKVIVEKKGVINRAGTQEKAIKERTVSSDNIVDRHLTIQEKTELVVVDVLKQEQQVKQVVEPVIQVVQKKSIVKKVLKVADTVKQRNLNLEVTKKIKKGSGVKNSKIDGDYEVIANMQPKRYTLQLLGLSKAEQARDYVNARNNLAKLYYFRSKQKQGNWYTVIYGNFESKEEALKAAKKMPASLTKTKPWVRTIKDIQLNLYK